MKIRLVPHVMVLGLVMAGSALAVDLSTLSNDELVQLRPSEMTDEERHNFRAEVRIRMADMDETERNAFRDQLRQQFERDAEAAIKHADKQGRGKGRGQGKGQRRGMGGQPGAME